MNCFKEGCVCHELCQMGQCIFKYDLIQGREAELSDAIGEKQGNDASKAVIALFEVIQPRPIRPVWVRRKKKKKRKTYEVNFDDGGKRYVKFEGEKCYEIGVVSRDMGKLAKVGDIVYGFSENKCLFFNDKFIQAHIIKSVRRYIKLYPSPIEPIPTPAVMKKYPKYLKDWGQDAHLSVNNNTSRAEQKKDDGIEKWGNEPESNFHYL